MLEAFIIDELKKREEELAKELERPILEIPAYNPYQIPKEPQNKIEPTIITFEI